MKHTSARHSRMLLPLLVAGMLLPLGSCMHYVTRQGNVLNPAKLAQIQLQDSRFEVETTIGTPVLKDDLHPNRAIYMEQFNDPKSGKKYMRRLEITYNESGRVVDIKRFGFGKAKTDAGSAPSAQGDSVDGINLPDPAKDNMGMPLGE